jgi:hypothetical protein
MASYMFNRPNLLKEGQQSSDCKQPKSSGDNKEGQKSGRFNEPGKRVTPFNGHPSRYESATQRAGEHKYTVYDRLICNTPSPLWRGHCIKDEISSCQVKTRPEDSAIECSLYPWYGLFSLYPWYGFSHCISLYPWYGFSHCIALERGFVMWATIARRDEKL